jgi:hypothetical protein
LNAKNAKAEEPEKPEEPEEDWFGSGCERFDLPRSVARAAGLPKGSEPVPFRLFPLFCLGVLGV